MSKRLTKTIWYGSDVDSNGNPILPSTHGGLDGLNYGELFLHLSNGKATLWTLSSDGKIVEITGGGSEVDMSSYLLKSIWDKVFEIRTDSQGTEYIFGKLPMVTQYGITMYSGDGVDIPSLASGLPFDGRTIWYNPDTNQIEVIGGTGGGSGEGVSNFWDLSGIPSWITNSKPKYTYSEIEGTPDLTQYALASQIPSLSGYATESWVTKQNYATKATTLSGYGITDAYTKTNVDDLLKSYVTLGGTQTITGEKNFVGGLKVNGSPIYYDREKKYWKLEGDLLVTGGVTMYGSDSSFTPSTIMDAIAVDGTTISKDGGVLKVIGGTGGGVADSVAWANITGKPTWIGSSKPNYSYSEITGAISTTELQNYLTSNSYLNVTSGDNRYLKLSGGTIDNNSTTNGVPLVLNTNYLTETALQISNNSVVKSVFGWYNGDSKYGTYMYSVSSRKYLGIKDDGTPHYHGNTLWHSGNDGSGSGLDADLLDGVQSSGYGKYVDNLTINLNDARDGLRGGKLYNATNAYDSTDASYRGFLEYGSSGYRAQFNSSSSNNLYYRWCEANTWKPWRKVAFEDSNVASATKLQTARTIWGQSFDGTGNVSGNLVGSNFGIYDVSGNPYIKFSSGGVSTLMQMLTTGALSLGSSYTHFVITQEGNVGIGTPNPKGKVDINGSIWIGAGDYVANRATLLLNSNKGNAADIIFKNGSTTTGNFGSWAISTRFESDHRFSIWRGGENGNISSEFEVLKLYANGNLLVVGGITMYSDQRKKTILNHVELSLKQIAEAPLIEHYYNGDEKRTTHVGSIAQYWASMNDWFCKLDSEGFYTMEIQNCALASAISIARELDRYETKTDKAIKKLKKRICELEEEVERLKAS